MADDEQARAAAMQRLDAFAGVWTLEASFPGGRIAGRAVFEWALDRQFMVQRSEVPDSGAPDSMAIVGYDPGRGAYLQHYFDSRGVTRVYAMDFTDGVWTLMRDAPDFTALEFSQRFIGTFSADGLRIDGRWEKSAAVGSDWEHDFDLTYVKVS